MRLNPFMLLLFAALMSLLSLTAVYALASWSRLDRSPSREPDCTNTCRFAYDGECDDGREGALYALCPCYTDCADCEGKTQ